jgi:Holliday junction resolvasome RuvABC endonuclease subunit
MLLALDPGASTGVAWGAPGAVPKFATWQAPWRRTTASVDLGAALSWFEDELIGHLEDHKITNVVFEAPWMPRGARADMEALKLVTCLCGVIEKACFERGVPCEEIAGATWNKAIIGNGAIHKQGVRQNLKWRGITARDQHQADAGGVWLGSLFIRQPDFRRTYAGQPHGRLPS